MNKCKCCKGDCSNFGDGFYIVTSKNNILLANDKYAAEYEDPEVVVNYCPICGRKLEVEE